VFEGKNGFFDVFGNKPQVEQLTKDLGKSYEIEKNLCKPYPAGIFIHAAIDACLEVRQKNSLSPDQIEAVRLVVHPLGVGLTGRTAPTDANEALVSIYHWTAVTLLTGLAGITEITDDCVRDPEVVTLRDKITAISDPTLARDEAHITVLAKDGRNFTAHISHARGGPENPLDDEQVAAKFAVQAEMMISRKQSDKIVSLCAGLEKVEDMRTLIDLLTTEQDLPSKTGNQIVAGIGV
jgi:2-methylcitrate dehydratase PrpD